MERKNGKKEKWFEEKCRRDKKELMEILWKRKKSEVKNEVCATVRKKYKELQKKKERCKEQWLREMKENKTMKSFWKGIGMKKKRVKGGVEKVL